MTGPRWAAGGGPTAHGGAPPVHLDDVRSALDAAAGDGWLRAAEARIRSDPRASARLLAEAPRRLGREPVIADWPAALAGRVVLLAALSTRPDGPALLAEAYRHGDSGEKLAVLRALSVLPDAAGSAAAVPLMHDALRTNDARLVAAALGPCAVHLDQAAWRQGVLKCVFLGISLQTVDRLSQRADAELVVMLRGLAAEREAAGRVLPPDAAALLRHLTADVPERQPTHRLVPPASPREM